MAYTSSALSFLLEDLGKTVVSKNSHPHFPYGWVIYLGHPDIDRRANPIV